MKCKSKLKRSVKLEDATEPLEFPVPRGNIIKGIPRDPDNCAGALSIKDIGYVGARVYRSTVHVQRRCGENWQRYRTNRALEMIEAFNDQKAIPTLQEVFRIRLEPPRKSATLEAARRHKKQYRKNAERGLVKKRMKKTNYPKRISPKDLFGIRAHAPRNVKWE